MLKNSTKMLPGIVVLVMLVACNRQAHPFIIFEHVANESQQLYRVYPDGSDRQLLIEFQPGTLYFISPKGNYVAALFFDPKVQSGRTMRLYDLRNGRLLNTLKNVGLMSYDSIPYTEIVTWSPNEQFLAILRQEEKQEAGSNAWLQERGSTDLWLYNLADYSVYPLTQDKSIERAPSWSSDGRQLAYSRFRACSDSSSDCSGWYWEIMVVDIESGESKPIVDMREHADLQQNVPRSETSLCNLTWSPNSTYLMFEDGCQALGPTLYKELYVTKLADRELIRLTHYSRDHGISYSSSWSSDSCHVYVLFSEAPFGQVEDMADFGSYLIVFSADNFTKTNEYELVSSGFFLDSGWSQDGRFIAVSPIEKKTIVGELDDVQLTIRKELYLPTPQCFPIQWSPQGDYLAYQTSEAIGQHCVSDNPLSINVIELATSAIVDITQPLGGHNKIVGWYLEE